MRYATQINEAHVFYKTIKNKSNNNDRERRQCNILVYSKLKFKQQSSISLSRNKKLNPDIIWTNLTMNAKA
jgi:hypothetical protein